MQSALDIQLSIIYIMLTNECHEFVNPQSNIPLSLGFLHLDIMFMCYVLRALTCLFVLIYALFVLLCIMNA